MVRRMLKLSIVCGLAWLPYACAGDAADPAENAPQAGANPFLQEQGEAGKADTQYQNPDGLEVEVDLEGDVQGDSWQLDEGPAMVGQFAQTYLRKRGDFYLESLAEDATSKDRVEWLIDGAWKTAAAVDAERISADRLGHFRLRGVNAVLLHKARTGVTEGQVFTATVPLKPFSVKAEAGAGCAEPDDHMSLSQDVYWYMWDPDRSDCHVATQELKVTVSKLLPAAKLTYPEYDQLVADGKVTAVVLFGKIGDGDIDTDSGMYGFKQMATWLKQAKFSEVTPAPVGRRFAKQIGQYTFEIDLYSPREFAGLDDSGNFANFQRAIGEHEIVTYDGHSMLGASDFWGRPTYPATYQIFLYGGCLGYEYYVRPILAGHGGWDTVDILSSVVEVSAGANDFAGPILAKLAYTLDHGFKVSWKDLLVAVRERVGDSTFGVSGVRENCFSPAGSLCGPTTPPAGESKRYADAVATPIPDDDATGIVRTLEVPDVLTIGSAKVELQATHSYPGDLLITLEHDGVTAKVWDNTRADGGTFTTAVTLADFAGHPAAGTWTLRVVDNAAVDEGTLDSWALTLTAP